MNTSKSFVDAEEEVEFFEAVQSTDDDEQSVKTHEIKALYEELDCLKARIQVIQERLKTIVFRYPEPETEDLEARLISSEKEEIYKLKKGQERLQGQINELSNNSVEARDQIKDIRMCMCSKARQILQLQKTIVKILAMKDSIEREFGKFIKRFEFVTQMKMLWDRVTQKFESQKVCYSRLEQSFVPKAYFLQEKKFFMTSINEIKEMVKGMFVYQSCRFRDLDDRLTKV